MRHLLCIRSGELDTYKLLAPMLTLPIAYAVCDLVSLLIYWNLNMYRVFRTRALKLENKPKGHQRIKL